MTFNPPIFNPPSLSHPVPLSPCHSLTLSLSHSTHPSLFCPLSLSFIFPFLTLTISHILFPNILSLSLTLSLSNSVSISLCLSLHLSPSDCLYLFLTVSLSLHFYLTLPLFSQSVCSFISLSVYPSLSSSFH